MEKKDYIVYNYLHRDEVISDNVMKTLDEVYDISYPKPEKSFNKMCEEITEKAKKEHRDNDSNFRIEYCDNKYMWPCDFYYLPQRVLENVWNNRKEAYGIEQHWHNNMQSLIDFLYEEPGMKEVYSPTEWSNGESIRHCEDMPLVSEIIGEEAAAKLKDVLESYQHTYRWGLYDVNQFAWGFMSTPSCNRDKVKNAWKEAFDIDIEIPDDDAWVDVFEMEEIEEENENNDNDE